MVSDQPSDDKGGGGEQCPVPLFAYTEKFKEVFPYYLSIGMTYDQFWNDDCELVKFYREAYRIKQKMRNQEAWLQGAYFYEALLDASPILRAFAKNGTKPEPYRKEPFDLFPVQAPRKESVQERNDKKAKCFMEAFAVANNKKYKMKDGESNGK